MVENFDVVVKFKKGEQFIANIRSNIIPRIGEYINIEDIDEVMAKYGEGFFQVVDVEYLYTQDGELDCVWLYVK